MKRVMVTGAAGFIGAALSLELAKRGYQIYGIDNLNDYYDVKLKKDRLSRLEEVINFQFKKLDISEKEQLSSTFEKFKPEIVINLAAFHILFAKFDACSNFSGIYLMSFPIVVPESTENLKLSAPYFSIISNGSTPFPNVLDIFLPWLSLTIPCIKTSLNGFSFVSSKLDTIILETQNVIISYAVTNTLVGKNVL